MPLNAIYRTYGRGTRRVSYMIDMIPRGTTSLATPAIINWPSGAITIDEPGDVGYENDFPVGYLQLNNWKITAHTNLMVGSEDINDGRDYVTHFKIEDAGLFSAVGGRFPLSNLWRIYSDEGRGDGTYVLVFEGIQWIDPSPEATVRIKKGASIQYQLQDIATATLRMADMERICAMANNPARSGDWADSYPEVIDSMWIGHGGFRASIFYHKDGYKARFMPMTKFMLAAQQICDDIYRQHIRIGDSWESDDDYHFYFSSSETDNYRTDPATPLDFFGFNEQDETSDNEVGGAIARTEWGIMDTIETDDGDPIGGLIWPGKDSFQSFGTLYDMLLPFWIFGVIRVVLRQDTPNVLQLQFMPAHLLGGAEVTVDLSLGDILTDRDKNQVQPKLHASAIQQQEWGAQDARGRDQDSWRDPKDATDQGQKFGGRIILDNNPIMGDSGWFVTANPSTYVAAGQSFQVAQLFPWKIYYMAHPWGQTNAIPCRVHHITRWPVGQTDEQAWGTNNPTPTTQPNYLKLYLAATAANQDLGGIQAAVIGAYRRFSDENQVLYPITVPIPLPSGQIINTRNVGSAVNLPTDDDGDYTINALLEPGADYVEGYGKGTIVRATPHIDKSTVELKLFGRGQ